MLDKLNFRMAVVLLGVMFGWMIISVCFVDDVEARARRGGRSFSSAPTSRPHTSPSVNRNTATPQKSSGSFMKGLAGGIAGGFLGSLLFGGVSHGMGMSGGFGGSGFGLIEILLIGGLIYFLCRMFLRKRSAASAVPYGPAANNRQFYHDASESHIFHEGSDTPPSDPVTEGINRIRISDPDFDPEMFKEIAQDVFFKIQACWMHRDISSVKPLLGEQLYAAYERELAEMKQKKLINRLENISVRKVDILDAGVTETGEEFITILFAANLLDYTIDESSGQVVAGHQTEPVKFFEKWSFARPLGVSSWRLEGVEDA